ncbi:hypothetical protein OG774_22005 [Actinomycetospora sp. NBC_00405]
MAPGGVDRSGVDVEAVHPGRRVAPRDADARPALTAADVGDPSAGAQRGVDLAEPRQVVAGEGIPQERAVLRRLALAGVVAEGLPAHAAARPVGLEEVVDVAQRRDEDPCERRQHRLAVEVGEHGDVRGGHREAALVGRGGRVVDGEHPAHRLVLEPLAGVAGGGPGARRELGRRGRAVLGERAEPAEPVAHVERGGLLHAEDPAEDGLGAGIGGVGGAVLCGRHGVDGGARACHGAVSMLSPRRYSGA